MTSVQGCEGKRIVRMKEKGGVLIEQFGRQSKKKDYDNANAPQPNNKMKRESSGIGQVSLLWQEGSDINSLYSTSSEKKDVFL